MIRKHFVPKGFRSSEDPKKKAMPPNTKPARVEIDAFIGHDRKPMMVERIKGEDGKWKKKSTMYDEKTKKFIVIEEDEEDEEELN